MSMKAFVVNASIAMALVTSIDGHARQTPEKMGWATIGNSSGMDMGHATTFDKNGNVYYAGMIAGSNIDIDPRAAVTDFRNTASGSVDVLLSKMDITGSYQWSRVIGGVAFDRGSSLITDANGNVFLMGNFSGVNINFNPTGTADYKTSGNSGTDYDIFVTKINVNGSYAWTKVLGGKTWTYGRTIATDSSGNIYVTGHFDAREDFTPEGTTRTWKTPVGAEDIFISKLNANGSYAWTHTMGSTGTDMGHSVAVDASNNIYFTGMFQYTVDLDPSTALTSNFTSKSSSIDVYLVKFNSAGTYQWGKVWGGNGWDAVYSVRTDAAKNIYLAGLFSGTADLDPGPTTAQNRTALGTNDLYVTKLNSSGTWLWSKTQGKSGLDYKFKGDAGVAMDVDTVGNVYVGACFNGTMDFNPDTGIDSKTSYGGLDGYVTRFTTSGTYVWTQQLGSSGDDCIHQLATNPVQRLPGAPTRDMFAVGTEADNLSITHFFDTSVYYYWYTYDTTGKYQTVAEALCTDNTSNIRQGVGTAKAQWIPTYTGTKPSGYFRAFVRPYLYNSATGIWYQQPDVDSGWKLDATASVSSPAYTLPAGYQLGDYAYGYRRENGIDTLISSPWSGTCW